MKQIFLGTSGYTYQDWKGRFYPEHLPQKEWLSYYSQQFATVEINATFYGSFTKEQIQHWADVTTKDFLFSIKGPRLITHVKRLLQIEDEVMRFFDGLTPLQEKSSCILWQLPGNFRCSSENLEKLDSFLDYLPRNVRQCVEFRDSSWFVPQLWDLLTARKTGFVISDTSEFATTEKVTADFAYIRFHGPSKLYASKYTEEDMHIWAGKVQEFAKEYDVYCYFNNDTNAYAIENARQLESYLSFRT